MTNKIKKIGISTKLFVRRNHINGATANEILIISSKNLRYSLKSRGIWSQANFSYLSIILKQTIWIKPFPHFSRVSIAYYVLFFFRYLTYSSTIKLRGTSKTRRSNTIHIWPVAMFTIIRKIQTATIIMTKPFAKSPKRPMFYQFFWFCFKFSYCLHLQLEVYIKVFIWIVGKF